MVGIPFGLKSPLQTLEEKTEQRHEENEKRFDKVEGVVSNIAGQLKVALLILVANGGLNIYLAVRGGK